MNKKNEIEIIALIFKSIDYLDLIYNQLKSDNCKVDGWDVKLRIISNDGSLEIIEKLKTLDIPHTIYHDKNKNDYYLNRVYRCWNYAGLTSKYENICFVNSDMVFTKNWLNNLLKYHDGINIPCSRLIESGKLHSGKYAIEFNCGKTPKTVNYNLWEKISGEFKSNEIKDGGLFMPCILNTKRFIESGMYPEGNIYDNGVGRLGNFLKSGDAYYFEFLEKKYNMKHVTVFNSLVYHIQEGEKDS